MQISDNDLPAEDPVFLTPQTNPFTLGLADLPQLLHSDSQSLSFRNQVALLPDRSRPDTLPLTLLFSELKTLMATINRPEIAFLAADLPHLNDLLAGIPPHIETHLLAPGEQLLPQLVAVLERHPGWGQFKALHLLTHGAPGELHLGAQKLDLAALEAHQPALLRLRAALSADAEVLLYGCEVAQGERGQKFVEALSANLSLPVAAASHKVGHPSGSGHWSLDVSRAPLRTPAMAVPEWPGVLGIPTLVTADSTPADDGTFSDGAANIVLVFSEDIRAKSSSAIDIYASNGTLIENFIAVGTFDFYGNKDGTAAISGSTITINPFADLSEGGYYLHIYNASGSLPALVSVSTGDAFADIKDSTSYNFTVGPVNTPPALSDAGGTLAFTEGDAASVIDTSLTLSDTDSADIASATVSVTDGYVSSEDVLGFTNQNGISGSWNSGTGVLTLTGTATLAEYEAALESVTYQNTNTANPNTSNRTITWVVNDGTDDSEPVTSTITVTDVNDAPTLSANASNPTFTEDGSAVTLFSEASASTVENGQTFTGLTLTVTNVTDSTESLTIDGSMIELANDTEGDTTTNSLSYSVSLSGSTATVTLTGGTVSAADLQTLINGISYSNSSQNPSTADDRVITITALQDSGGGVDTASLNITSTVAVAAVNDAPVIDLSATTAGNDHNATFAAGGAAVAITDSDATLTDGDSATLASLTVTLSNRPDGDDKEGLSLNSSAQTAATGAGLTVSYTEATGVLSISGAASSAVYQEILRGVVYQNTDTKADIDTSDRSISVVANDGTDDAVQRTTTLKVIIPPEISYSAATFTESSANDGSLDSVLSLTLAVDTFADDVISAGKISTSNLPAGLVPVYTLVSDTEISLRLAGQASAHENANDISNLGISFQDGAFTTTADASQVISYARNDLAVDFADAPVTTRTIDTLGNTDVTFTTNNGGLTDLTNSAAPGGLPRGLKMPVGQFGFELDGVAAGGTATITMEVDASKKVSGFFKQDDQGKWVNLADSVTTEGGQTLISFSIQDNGPWDSDATLGRIVDPGGLGENLLAPFVAENTTSVGDMSEALDLSGLTGTVSYSLSGEDAGKFSINALTGALSFASAPDFESPTDDGDTAGNNTYAVTVTATGSESGTNAADLIVTVFNDTGADGKVANLQGDSTGFTPGTAEYVDADSSDFVDITHATDESNGTFANGYLLISQIEGTADGDFSFDTDGIKSGGDGDIGAGELLTSGSGGVVALTGSGFVDATKTGQDGQELLIHLNGSVTVTDVEWIVSFLQYTAPTEGNRTFSLALNDGTNAYEAVTFSMNAADTTAPTLDAAGSTPADDAASVAASASLQLKFSESIYFTPGSSGSISLYNVADSQLVETFGIAEIGSGDGRIAISGDTLTINPTGALGFNTQYAVQIGANLIQDAAGNTLAAIADNVTYNFTTSANTAPVLAGVLSETTQGFETSDSLTSNFNDGNATPVMSWSETAGLSGGGGVSIPGGTSEVWTANQGLTLVIGETYTLSTFAYISGNSGYGGLGFAVNDSNLPGSTTAGTNGFNLGIGFHGGGGSYINDDSETNLSWTGTSGGDALVTGNWYRLSYAITPTGSNNFEVSFEIWNSDASGVVGTRAADPVSTTLTNTHLTEGLTVYPYFSNNGSRLGVIDDFTVTSFSSGYALTATDEDTTSTSTAVSTILSGLGYSDSDSAQSGAAISETTGNGAWQYSTDGGSTWTAVGAVSASAALLLDADQLLRYVPDGVSDETATLTLRGWDQSSGAPGTTADTSSNGGSTAFSATTGTVSISVTEVNDAPTLSANGSDPTFTED
ncbi:MAG: DUF4347 domain-containing protein, partial [Lamprobacter sp.]|nr:DUF4347 domain-containing protein [Lamprobacter sp.]